MNKKTKSILLFMLFNVAIRQFEIIYVVILLTCFYWKTRSLRTYPTE